MAKEEGKKDKASGKKRARKPKKPSKRWSHYKISGGKIERTSSFCPKCGPGFFLAAHKNRTTCGKCGYSEFKAKETKK